MADKIRIQRANVILDVSPEEKEMYMEKGFSVIDATTGEVLEEAMPTDVKVLQLKVKELQKTLADRDAEIRALKAKKVGKVVNKE